MQDFQWNEKCQNKLKPSPILKKIGSLLHLVSNTKTIGLTLLSYCKQSFVNY